MESFPPIPLDAWRESKETLHRFAQIVGKIRLAASVRRNHWWNVPFEGHRARVLRPRLPRGG